MEGSVDGPGTEMSAEDRENWWMAIERGELGNLNARVGDDVVMWWRGRICRNRWIEQDLVIGNSLFRNRDVHNHPWGKMTHGRDR